MLSWKYFIEKIKILTRNDMFYYFFYFYYIRYCPNILFRSVEISQLWLVVSKN